MSKFIVLIIFVAISIYKSVRRQSNGSSRQNYSPKPNKSTNQYPNRNINSNTSRRPNTVNTSANVRPQQRLANQSAGGRSINSIKSADTIAADKNPGNIDISGSEGYLSTGSLSFSSQEGKAVENIESINEAITESSELNENESFIDIIEDLPKSILAAEILGLPRALKPNIR